MKSIILSLSGVILLCSSLICQNSSECSANVRALEKQILRLAEELGDESILNELVAIQEEEFSDIRITLSENDPNPYEFSKEIKLSIPESAGEVEVVFSNSLGQTLKKLHIMDRGETLIKVYMSEYLLGEYQYKLVVDGNPIKS